jgi:vancomycin resistance protein YoaR
MNTYQTPQPAATPQTSSLPSSVGKALMALIAGLVLFAVLVAAVPVGYNLLFSGRIYPGVSVAGIDLSGMSTDEAAALLAQKLDYPEQGKIIFQEGTNAWVAKPGEVGLLLDSQTSALAAYNVGRGDGLISRLTTQFWAWYHGEDIPPLYVLDERIAQHYLMKIAEGVDRPVIEASLEVDGVEVVVLEGQVGLTLDVPGAIEDLQAHVQTLTDGVITLKVTETPPVIMDVNEQAEIARQILGAPLVIKVPDSEEDDPGPWTFEPPALAQMLTIERVETPEGARYQVGLNSDNLRVFLNGVAPGFVRYPENARFIFNDDTRQLDLIRPAVIGRALDVETSIQLVNEKVMEGEHTVMLDMEYTNPPVVNDMTAEELGISEAVSVHTSYFYGSSASRIKNIQTASARFHGVLIPPGETFSMADVLGDVSLDTGYAEALIIFGDRTIKGVGGGVCQVSTTLFRTVFFGGYPVLERHPHAYRVGYYEQTASGGHNPDYAGLDATVFVPVVDFRFTNDSPNWLLMETYVNPDARTLTWKFYSTSDGRVVEWHTTGPNNVVEPPDPKYEENPELAKGEVKQVDWAAEGADVTVNRMVYKNGDLYFDDAFSTHYMPWQAVYQYGPGTDGMPPESDGDD